MSEAKRSRSDTHSIRAKTVSEAVQQHKSVRLPDGGVAFQCKSCGRAFAIPHVLEGSRQLKLITNGKEKYWWPPAVEQPMLYAGLCTTHGCIRHMALTLEEIAGAFGFNSLGDLAETTVPPEMMQLRRKLAVDMKSFEITNMALMGLFRPDPSPSYWILTRPERTDQYERVRAREGLHKYNKPRSSRRKFTWDEEDQV